MSLLPEPVACLVCMKEVLDSEKGLLCDEKCGRWFHSSCMGISDSDYRKLANDNNRKWYCGRVDCTESRQHPLNQMFSRFDSVSSQMALVLSKLDNLSNIPTDINAIKNELASVNEKLSGFEPRISEIEKRVESLEAGLKCIQVGEHNPVGVEPVLEELVDRTRRSKNLIFHDLPESGSKVLTKRIEHDNRLVSVLLQNFCNDNATFKSFRIGKPSGVKPRPLKVVLAGNGDVGEFAKNFDQSRLKDLDPLLGKVTFSRDRTVLERRHLANLRAELQRRTDAGEVNLTIRYIQGVPKLVEKKSKNQ